MKHDPLKNTELKEREKQKYLKKKEKRQIKSIKESIDNDLKKKASLKFLLAPLQVEYTRTLVTKKKFKHQREMAID